MLLQESGKVSLKSQVKGSKPVGAIGFSVLDAHTDHVYCVFSWQLKLSLRDLCSLVEASLSKGILVSSSHKSLKVVCPISRISSKLQASLEICKSTYHEIGEHCIKYLPWPKWRFRFSGYRYPQLRTILIKFSFSSPPTDRERGEKPNMNLGKWEFFQPAPRGGNRRTLLGHALSSWEEECKSAPIFCIEAEICMMTFFASFSFLHRLGSSKFCRIMVCLVHDCILNAKPWV